MKKFVTLFLAALMVMSLGVTAFASSVTLPTPVGTIKAANATDLDTTTPKHIGVGLLDTATAYVSPRDKDATADDVLVPLPGAIAPGTSIYYPLIATNSTSTAPVPVRIADAVKSAKISVTNQTGGEYIESFRIEYKKFGKVGTTSGGTYTPSAYDDDYSYVLAIKTKDRADTGLKHFGAQVKISKTSGSPKSTEGTGSYEFAMTYRLGLTVNYTRVTNNVYRFPIVLNYNYSVVTPDSVETIEFPEAGDVTFDVDMFQQGRIIAAFNNTYNAEIAAKYPAANLDFYNGNGAMFAKIGELTIPAEPGSFIYVQDAEGNLAKVDATYDDGEEAFKIPTRTLGQYVVSDVELDLTVAPEAPVEPSEPVEEPKAPVATGVAA